MNENDKRLIRRYQHVVYFAYWFIRSRTAASPLCNYIWSYGDQSASCTSHVTCNLQRIRYRLVSIYDALLGYTLQRSHLSIILLTSSQKLINNSQSMQIILVVIAIFYKTPTYVHRLTWTCVCRLHSDAENRSHCDYNTSNARHIVFWRRK